MSTPSQDGLWPHFVPLWTDLRAISPKLLLAGGYALFLKQRWLIEQTPQITTSGGKTIVTESGDALVAVQVPTIVDMTRWGDTNPRVTKDFDFIVELGVIASEADQKALQAALEKHGFEVVPYNARWQFQKKLNPDQTVLVDFHAPTPTEPRDDLRVEKRRVKPGRSLGARGIHGRENPEANATALQPFSFTYQSLEIAIPHPVAFALMKLVAMNDRWRAASDATKTVDVRRDEGRLAFKHAEDILRIVAMTTRAERDSADSVIKALRDTASFGAVAKIVAERFQTGAPLMIAARQWRDEDFALMRGILEQWFGPAR